MDVNKYIPNLDLTQVPQYEEPAVVSNSRNSGGSHSRSSSSLSHQRSVSLDEGLSSYQLNTAEREVLGLAPGEDILDLTHKDFSVTEGTFGDGCDDFGDDLERVWEELAYKEVCLGEQKKELGWFDFDEKKALEAREKKLQALGDRLNKSVAIFMELAHECLATKVCVKDLVSEIKAYEESKPVSTKDLMSTGLGLYEMRAAAKMPVMVTVTPGMVVNYLKNETTVSELDFSGWAFTDEQVIHLLNHWKDNEGLGYLESLDFTGCKRITGGLLPKILEICPDLDITINDCEQISELNVAKLAEGMALSLYVKGDVAKLADFLQSFQGFERLNLSGLDYSKTDLSVMLGCLDQENLSSLKVLDLSGCTKMTSRKMKKILGSFSKNAPSLREIVLKDCSWLKQEIVNELNSRLGENIVVSTGEDVFSDLPKKGSALGKVKKLRETLRNSVKSLSRNGSFRSSSSSSSSSTSSSSNTSSASTTPRVVRSLATTPRQTRGRPRSRTLTTMSAFNLRDIENARLNLKKTPRSLDKGKEESA